VHFNGTFYCKEREKLIEQSTKDEAIKPCAGYPPGRWTVPNFRSSRKNCMAFAKKAASKIKKILSAEDKKFFD